MKDSGYWKFFCIMLIVILAMSATSMITPIYLQICESSGAVLNIGTLVLVALLLVASKIVNVLLTMLREQFAKSFNKRNCRQMIASMLNMRYDAILEEGPTNLLEKITMAVNSIYGYLTGGFIRIWSGVAIIVLCISLVALNNLGIALVLTTLIPINYFGYKFLNQELTRRAQELQRNMSEGVQEILTRVQQIDYLKQLSDHEKVIRGIEPSLEKMYGSMAKVNIYAQGVSSSLGAINDVVQNICMIYLAIGFVRADSSVYDIILFAVIVPMFFSAINDVVCANIARRDYDIALEFQKYMEEQKEPTGKTKITSIETIDLAVDHVSVPGRTIPFQAVGTLRKGEIVKVNGVSGSGKSTFAKALVKFRESKGISYNGIPADEIENQSLRAHIEYLSQNIPIIKGTLRDNLFLNIPWCSSVENEIISDPIMLSILKDKTMDSEIQEGGGNLSGGEKQKIALMRALLKHVDVLILDEVCSNVDQESTEMIYRRIEQGRNDRITVIITHDELPAGFVTTELSGGFI
jgi:subfamily B ATP-binding cassette protein MsbA